MCFSCLVFSSSSILLGTQFRAIAMHWQWLKIIVPALGIADEWRMSLVMSQTIPLEIQCSQHIKSVSVHPHTG